MTRCCNAPRPAFEAARERGGGRVELDGALVEMPAHSNAKRLIARAEALRQFNRRS